VSASFDSRARRRSRRTGGARGQTGFTLLELVVVIAIFAVFSLMAYGGLDSVLKTRAQVETSQARLAQLQKAYLRLRNDLQQLRNRPARDGFGDTQPALRATDKAYVEFTRAGWRNPLRMPRSGLERVAYRYEGGKLVRVSWRVLDLAQDSRPVENVLIDGIEDLRWRFLDDAREWRDSWPVDVFDTAAFAASVPPRAVELTLRTTDFGELRYLFRLGSDYPVIAQRYQSSNPQTGTAGDIPSAPRGDQGNGIPPANPADFP
jgi:general secretion pathway protein J